MSARKDDIIRKYNVNIVGNGTEPIMLAHGFIGDQEVWRFIVPALIEKYKVVLFDFMGSGKSDLNHYDKTKYSTLQGYAEDVLEICEALNLRNVTYVGHSIASMIGLIAAIDSGHFFKRMVFVAPSPSFINQGNYFGGFDRKEIDTIITKIETDHASWAKEIAPIVLKAPDQPALSDELVSSIVSRNERAVKAFAAATFFADYRKELLKFKTPSLIIQCSEDIMAPLHVGDYLHAHMMNSTLKILMAKGHFPQLSAPDELVKVIVGYLDEVENLDMHE